MRLRRRVVGFAALLLATASLLLAVETVPATPVTPAAAGSGSPRSPLAAPALFAAGSILLVGGAAAAVDGDLSARAALLAPLAGAVSAVASGVTLGAGAFPDAATAVVAGSTAAVAAGAVVGSAVAPTVRASTTGDTAALLVGAVLLLASVAIASDAVPSLAAGGLGGVTGVAAFWLADAEAWRP